MERLLSYQWPGNVRELQNALQRAVVLERGEKVSMTSLPEAVTGGLPSASLSLDELEGESLADMIKRVKSRYEKVLIQEALDKAGGNKTKAAQLLKISRVNLHQKINEYEIEAVPHESE